MTRKPVCIKAITESVFTIRDSAGNRGSFDLTKVMLTQSSPARCAGIGVPRARDDTAPEGTMLLILLIVLILAFGYGGYRVGPGWGYYGGGGLSLVLTIILILVLLRVI
jgi:hypothetical protein